MWNDVNLLHTLALAFTSLKYQPDECTRGGIQCFQIHGALYHRTGPLEHDANIRPQFAQIFLYDPEDAIEQQLRTRPGGHVLLQVIDPRLFKELLDMLHECNPFIAIYHTIYERLKDAVAHIPAEQLQVLLIPRMELMCTSGADTQRHNIPIANEVAMVIPDEYGIASHRDIILASRNVAEGCAYQFYIGSPLSSGL